MNVRFWQKVKVKLQHLLVWSRNRLVVRISKHIGRERESHWAVARLLWKSKFQSADVCTVRTRRLGKTSEVFGLRCGGLMGPFCWRPYFFSIGYFQHIYNVNTFLNMPLLGVALAALALGKIQLQSSRMQLKRTRFSFISTLGQNTLIML